MIDEGKILLTGGTGFLGTEIVNFFSVQFGGIIKLCGRGRQCDYSFDLAKNPIKFAEDFVLVIHAAGKAHTVPKSQSQIQDFFDINVRGTENLLGSLELQSVLPKYFVFISSVAVYGLDSGININENSKLNATDPYGKSKILAEAIVIEWCKKNNVVCTILRLPLLFGFNAPGNLGAMILGIKKGYYFNIDSGRAKKSILYVKDVPVFIQIAHKIGGIYNLTDGYHPSFNELSHFLALQMGKKNVFNLPLFWANTIAKFGVIVGKRFPLNSDILLKMTSTLTFDDKKARTVFNWESRKILSL